MKLCHLQQHRWTYGIILLSEVIQKEKQIYDIIFIYGISNMTHMNLSMIQKHIQRHRRQTCIFQAWVGGGRGVGWRKNGLGLWVYWMHTKI